jgi:hypothetical protein
LSLEDAREERKPPLQQGRPVNEGWRKVDAFELFRAFGKDNVKYIKLRSFDYKIDCKTPYAISVSTPTFVLKGCKYCI